MDKKESSAIDEIRGELKDALSSRLRSPFVGVFVFSWLAWNHRLFFVLFSDMKVGKRFGYIDEELYSSASHFVSLNLLLPLLSTAVYIMVVPWVTELAHRWNLRMQRRLYEANLRSQHREVMTEDQAAQLRQLVASKNNKISELKDELNRQRATASRVTAMHAAIADPDSVDTGAKIVEYLLSSTFALRGRADSLADLSSHSFERDGQVHSRVVHRDRSVLAQGWAFRNGRLEMLAADDLLLASFTFNPRSGQFEGSVGNREVFLISRAA